MDTECECDRPHDLTSKKILEGIFGPLMECHWHYYRELAGDVWMTPFELIGDDLGEWTFVINEFEGTLHVDCTMRLPGISGLMGVGRRSSDLQYFSLTELTELTELRSELMTTGRAFAAKTRERLIERGLLQSSVDG